VPVRLRKLHHVEVRAGGVNLMDGVHYPVFSAKRPPFIPPRHLRHGCFS